MKRAPLHIIFFLSTMLIFFSARSNAQLVPNLGGQRAGISAMQFLKIGVGARGVSMGESFVAVANDVSALFWNPAGLVLFPDNQAFFSRTEYVVNIKHDFVGAVYHLTDQDVIGASFTSLHMDDMKVTTETQPFGDGNYFKFGDLAIAVTYSKRMTEQFSFGATLRYAEETLDVLKMRGVMIDLGTWYSLGLGSARFAVVISNFGGEVEPKGSARSGNGTTVTTFQSFSVPTIFKLGIAFDPINEEGHLLTTSVQLNHPNDNSEHVRFGAEYGWNDMFFLRAGVKRTIGQRFFGADATSEEDFAAGAGVKLHLAGISTITVDYAFSNYQRLGAIHRISLGSSF